MNDSLLKSVKIFRSVLQENKLSGEFMFPDGSTQHYVRGHRHREDGPAVILANGTQLWYRDDALRRDDGPPITAPKGHHFW